MLSFLDKTDSMSWLANNRSLPKTAIKGVERELFH